MSPINCFGIALMNSSVLRAIDFILVVLRESLKNQVYNLLA